jgi:hypothetical protein
VSSNWQQLDFGTESANLFDTGWMVQLDDFKGVIMKDMQFLQLLVQILIVYVGTGVFVFFTLVQ